MRSSARTAADVERQASRCADPTALNEALMRCRACPRLVTWREEVAVTRRAAYADQAYWGRPVPSFGADAPSILILGLAPGAHGANRTGRMFTGDRSGDWLFGSLHRVGLASSPTSVARDDGQRLDGVRITAAAHCAPPDNAPSREEFATCAGWLHRELTLIAPTLRVVVALGGLAWRAALDAAPEVGWSVPRPKPRFAHGAEARLGTITLLGSYHPSQQNTFTGRVTEPMLDAVFARAVTLAGS